jgi:hypothetical protein
MPAPTIARLTEILNACGVAPTLQEVQAYLDPQVKQALHMSAAVEDRLREIEAQVRCREVEWHETLASLSRPWRDELVQIEAAGTSQILGHATHNGDRRCSCWAVARYQYFSAIDRWADDRQAVGEFEKVWDALEELSMVHRPPQQEDIATNIAAAVSDALEEQIAASLRDAAFLGRKRVR